ncbi:MAG TPA: hypothetical protein VL522_20110, partial [Bordetella sp.]|nr:hypothetical protein [Bordetella sp.]
MTDIWQGGKTYVPGALVKPSSTTVVAQPQPTNGDFETGDLTGWAQAASRWANTSTTPYAGTKCVVLSGSGIDSLNNTNVVPVKPGQRITAQAMAKLTNSGTNDQGAQIIIVWRNASHAEIGTTLGTLIYGQGGYWKLTSASGAAPAGTAEAFIRLNGNNGTHGGTLEFDQVSWDYAYQAPPPGLIFKATQAAPGKSGSAEPTWPTTAGVPVTDNEVTWEGVIASRVVWEASPIMQTGSTEPVWPLSAGAIVHDGNMDWVAITSQITDKNCPNSKVVAIMASKVFAADKDIVRFSATVNPLDWSSAQDAGYLPTGLQQANSNDMAVLAPYRSNLTAFNASSFQNWQVDPDPSAMSLLDQMEGIGSSWQHAAQPVGNELFYLSQLGVRSVGIAAGTDNLASGDIGMPVDVLVRDSIRIAAANVTPVLATYYPGAGQYWLAFPNYPPSALTVSGSLPQGLPGDVVNYSYTYSGGVHPVTFSIVSGALPAGLSMDAAGLVTGQRTGLVVANWTVQGLDADGAIATLVDSDTPIAGYSTWDNMTVPAGGTLSVDLATLSATNGTTGSVFSNAPIAGKCYFEAQITTPGGLDGAEAGVAGATFDRRVYRMGEGSNNSVGVAVASGTVKGNGTVIGTIDAGALANSMRLRFAVDEATRTVWIGAVGQTGWVGGGNPATGTTPTYTMPGTARMFPGGSTNTGATASVKHITDPALFTGAVPAGFSSGLWVPFDNGYAATLDPLVTASACVLSNGNLTGTNIGSNLFYAWTVSNRIKRKGKPYWEVIAKSGTTSGDRCVWGVSNEGSDYLGYFAIQPVARGYGIGATGGKFVGTTASALTTGINTGDVIRNRFDIDAG